MKQIAIPWAICVSVVCLVVAGELNRQTYTSLIDLASAHYRPKRRGLLLDLRQTTQFELSGLFALHRPAL